MSLKRHPFSLYLFIYLFNFGINPLPLKSFFFFKTPFPSYQNPNPKRKSLTLREEELVWERQNLGSPVWEREAESVWERGLVGLRVRDKSSCKERSRYWQARSIWRQRETKILSIQMLLFLKVNRFNHQGKLIQSPKKTDSITFISNRQPQILSLSNRFFLSQC